MSKAIPQDVKKLGFSEAMFEGLEELQSVTFEEWIQAKLDAAAMTLLREIPSTTYEKTDALDLVVNAEACLAGAEMARVKRLLSAEDQETVSVGPIGGLGNSGRTFAAFGALANELESRAAGFIERLKKLSPPVDRIGMIFVPGE